MKKTLILLAILVTSSTFAQGNWAPYASIEENIHISDVRPSYNYINLSTLAGNAGMRLGAFYTHNSTLSAEVTLGVVGVSTPGRFSNTIIPVEAVGHYNILDDMDLKMPSKFNIDLGIGSGLAEVDNGNFGFSEHLVVGASMEISDLIPFGTVIMGTRYTAFVDDYIDGTVVSNSFNDGILRFYTAVRMDGIGKKAKQAMADAEALAAKVSSALEKSEDEKSILEKELKANKNAHAKEKAALMDEIEALKAAPAPKAPVEEKAVTAEPKGFYIIIGSFPARVAAQRYIDEMGPEYSISFVENLKTYRVVYSKHDSLSEARAALKEAKSIVKTAWIAVY